MMRFEVPAGLYGMVDLPRRQALDGKQGMAASRAAGLLGKALLLGGSRILQLRMKDASASAMLEVLVELRRVVDGWEQARLIVNDRVDVALEAGAHGVHLGQGDLPLSSARRMVPPNFCIGVSTHDEEQAQRAMEGGADYVAFGPIYQTGSKDNPEPAVGLDRLRALCGRASVPIIAIGGITLERVPEIVRAGAHAAAIIAAVNQAKNVRVAAESVTRAFKQTR